MSVSFSPTKNCQCGYSTDSGEIGVVDIQTKSRNVLRQQTQTNALVKSDNRLAWSPAGDQIAYSHEDHSLRIVSAATGKEHKRLLGPKEAIGSIDWSFDGKLVACGGDDGMVFVWRLAD